MSEPLTAALDDGRLRLTAPPFYTGPAPSGDASGARAAAPRVAQGRRYRVCG